MKVRVPDYFKDFKCIASQCEDTCCAGWEVVIDDKAYDYYKTVGGTFGERLKNEIVCDDGENVFKLKKNNCAFLNEKMLCDIYNELGEAGLCFICKQYPRVMEEFGGLREIGLSLSCPEVARLVLNNPKKIDFELSENNEEFSSYNDIDGLLYLMLMQGRKVAFNILQNRNIALKDRAALVLQFANELQKEIDEDNTINLKTIIERYAKESFVKEAVKGLEIYNEKEKFKYDSIFEWLEVYKNLIHINDNDPLALERASNTFYGEGKTMEAYIDCHRSFDKFYESMEYKFEHILVYFVFRYFMKAVFDYDVAGKMKLAVVSYLIIKELCVVSWKENNKEFTDKDMVHIAHMYSKDVEHLEENIDILTGIFENEDIFTLEKILTVLMNSYV